MIQFSYVEKYPEEPPLFEIVDNENLEDDQIEEIISLINEQVLSSIIVHVFHTGIKQSNTCSTCTCILYKIL